MTTPKVFISYSHDSPEHQQRVLELSNRLRSDGVDCHIDQYEISPPEGWPTWMARMIREADFVIVVCTPTYLRRFNGEEKAGVGLGVRWESMLGMQDIYDRGALNVKFVPIIFDYADAASIPSVLRGATHFCLKSDEGYGQLYARLLCIPRATRPLLGAVKQHILRPAPPLDRRPEFFEPYISIARLPIVSPRLFGRDAELQVLDDAWADEKTNVIEVVAFGGIGKTALVNAWVRRLQADKYRGARRVFAWTFYSQGAAQHRNVSSDDFISAALQWFGDPNPNAGSAWSKGERLAHLIRVSRTLVILDGLEPLQYPPGEQGGRVRDSAMHTLLRELAADNQGLCVLSTRLEVNDLSDYVDPTVRRINLNALREEPGAELLRDLGVLGPEPKLKQAVREFEGHALALSLLGRYLAIVHRGDIRRRDQVPTLTAEPRLGGHDRRVMASYETWFEGTPELSILRALA